MFSRVKVQVHFSGFFYCVQSDFRATHLSLTMQWESIDKNKTRLDDEVTGDEIYFLKC